MSNGINRIIKRGEWGTYYIEDLLWISMYMIEDKFIAIGMKPHEDYTARDIISMSIHLVPHINRPDRGIRLFDDQN